jgi:RNA recognition motif-containing protein
MAEGSQTIYLNNLPDKMKKLRLRRQLYNLCTKFGTLLDVIVHPGNKMRGQAWIVYSSSDAAAKAIPKLNGYSFFDKPIKAQFAKENADVIAKLNGKFVRRTRKRAADTITATATKEQDGNGSIEAKPKRMKTATETAAAETTTTTSAPAASGGGGHDANNPPGPILKLDTLPDSATKESLQSLFAKFEGFIELRHVPTMSLAFVEYSTTEQAKVAKEGLKGYQITPSTKLRIYYAKPKDASS